MKNWLVIGVSLSIIWAVTSGVHQLVSDQQRAREFGDFSHRVCLQSKAVDHDSDPVSCDKEEQDSTATMLVGSWENAAFIAFVPIPLAWFVAFIFFKICHIFAAGFRVVVPWATLSAPKKGFITLSVLACLAASMFGAVMMMNLYVDTQVPVALGVKAMVIQTGDVVTAEGTWTRSGLTSGDEMGYPLQTSYIQCYRPENRCEEARASVAGSLLAADLVEYEIESWSNTTIVFKNEAPCASEEYTIDLKTQSVNGVGHLINKGKDFCKSPLDANSADNWTYHLADGFGIYWEERNKARPIPLRIFQAMFGK